MSFRVPSASQVHALVDGLQVPDGFLFGTATAGYQCEGGYNLGDGPRNNWAEWESRPGNNRTGPASRFWDAPERDLDLANGLNCSAFRLSLEWARLEPVNARELRDEAPTFDLAAANRYADILAGARARGMEPVVTLHHFTHPWWLGPDPWLSDKGPQLFAAYVGRAVAVINDALAARGNAPIRWWITINEPNTLAPATYLSRIMPCGHSLDLGSPARVVRMLDGLYAAHVLAYGEIHRWYATRGLARPTVAFNNIALDLYGLDRFFVDLILSRSRGVPFGPALTKELADREKAWNKALSNLVSRSRAHAPERWLLARGLRALAPRLFTWERFPRVRAALETSDWARPLDVIALDYYDATLANQLRLAGGSYEPWEWEAIPEGFFELLRASATDGLPVFVAENGMSTRRLVGGPAEPRADGLARDEFLRAHVFQLLRALKAGTPVAGYLHWSLTDDYEWGRFSPRFGLFGVDYSAEDRPRFAVDASGTDAAGAFRAIAGAIGTRDSAALEAALGG